MLNSEKIDTSKMKPEIKEPHFVFTEKEKTAMRQKAAEEKRLVEGKRKIEGKQLDERGGTEEGTITKFPQVEKVDMTLEEKEEAATERLQERYKEKEQLKKPIEEGEVKQEKVSEKPSFEKFKAQQEAECQKKLEAARQKKDAAYENKDKEKIAA